MMDDFDLLDEADDALKEKSGGGFGGELVLLILSEKARGHGLGKRLFSGACDYLRSKGAKSMFFYTDTDCNFGFYDAMGAVRLGHVDTLCLGQRIGMFIYRYDL